MRITSIVSREVLDSRGNPTIEVDLFLNDSTSYGRGTVPSGASCGKTEAIEMRDEFDQLRYNGLGVKKAIHIIDTVIAPKLIGKDFRSQVDFDHYLIDMDGSDSKGNLGANSILALSIAFAKATAIHKNVFLFQSIIDEFGLEKAVTTPTPMFNIINGGKHGMDSGVTLQEFMVVISATSIHEQLSSIHTIFNNLKRTLVRLSNGVGIGDEGGFTPRLNSNEDAVKLIQAAIVSSNMGHIAKIAIDAAASTFFQNAHYNVESSSAPLSSDDLIKYYQRLINLYPIISIEDPMSEEDVDGWINITGKFSQTSILPKDGAMGEHCFVIGDDIFTTNRALFQKYAIKYGIGHGIIIKPNQIGTLTETIEMIMMARKHGYAIIVSHRSGETEDTSISHIATAVNSDGKVYMKAGAPCRGERICKYNELIRISEVL